MFGDIKVLSGKANAEDPTVYIFKIFIAFFILQFYLSDSMSCSLRVEYCTKVN